MMISEVKALENGELSSITHLFPNFAKKINDLGATLPL